MVAGTLYTFAESLRASKCRVAAEYGQVQLNVVEVKEGDSSRTHYPSFESSDKKVNLFDANAIAYFLSNDQLRGSSLEDRARVLQWIGYGSTEVESAVLSWVYPTLGLVESNQQNVKRAQQDLKTVFEFVNQHLQTRSYLVGERITLADISLAADLLLAYQHVADEQFRAPFVNLNRWFTTIINQRQFQKVVGQVTLVAKAAEYDPKKAAAKKPAKEQKAQPAKPAKEPAKPKEKPAAEPAEEADLADEALASEPKQADPFAAMPKGNFNMDEFKRTYSNEETPVALDYFWKNFEKEFYSIWYCEYKFPEDFTMTFMTSNLISGMYQRIEKLRKNAFASMCVWGVNNNNTIAGVWFWRGQELVFPLCSDWTTDYESYNWRKMNPDDENDRKLLNQVFSWEGDINGRKFSDGKIFK